MKNLENFGVQEMSTQEIIEIGGSWAWGLGLLAWYAHATLDDRDSAKAAANSGFAAAQE